jgi:hypothetical protein
VDDGQWWVRSLANSKPGGQGPLYSRVPLWTRRNCVPSAAMPGPVTVQSRHHASPTIASSLHLPRPHLTPPPAAAPRCLLASSRSQARPPHGIAKKGGVRSLARWPTAGAGGRPASGPWLGHEIWLGGRLEHEVLRNPAGVDLLWLSGLFLNGAAAAEAGSIVVVVVE